MPTPFRLCLPRDVFEAVIAQAVAELPNECCGLLAGRVEEADSDVGVGTVLARYPLPNAAASPREYQADARPLIDAHKDMRNRGLEQLAVYHSHPASAPVPSPTDHERWAHGPGVVCLIVSLAASPPSVRGWWMTEAGHSEAEVQVTR